MRALFIAQAGPQPQLAVRRVPRPDPGPGEVRLRVAACGFCGHDVALMSGLLRRGARYDVAPGHEVSGVVDAVGAGVTSLREGDPGVATLTIFCGRCERCEEGKQYRCLHGQGLGHAVHGGMAEYVVLPERCLVPLPPDLDAHALQAAALLACPIGVVLQGLRDVADLRQGETALVLGAGGGLGVHALQVTTALGARALAVTGSPHKARQLEEWGYEVVPYAEDLELSEVVMALTEDRGVDVVVNPVGSALFGEAVSCLAPYGRLLLLGEVTGQAVRFHAAELLFRDASVLASTGAQPAHLREAVEMMASGAVRPVIWRRMSLEQAEEAYEAMINRRPLGRVLLVP